MKLWLSGEIDYTIGNEFRDLINEIENSINGYLENSEYKKLEFSWDVVFVILKGEVKEKLKFNKTTKESDIKTAIDLTKFQNSDMNERRDLLILSLLNSLKLLNEKYMIADFKNLYLELNQKLKMDSNIKRLEETFAKMITDDFEIESPLLWGFYFVDSNKDNLLDVYNELKDSNYTLVSLDKQDDDKWQLFVTKVETMTPERLSKRITAFHELADYCQVESFDGWDVERI